MDLRFPSIELAGGRRQEWRNDIPAAARMVVAATAAWTIAALGLHYREPVLGPVAAVLTVQGTVYSTLRRGAQVCAGVLLGAAFGVGFGSVSGSHWWTIAAATAISFGARYLPGLRGGPVNQVSVTALLVVSLGRGYGYTRVVDTAIGAAAGIAATFAVFPPVRVPESVGALGDLAADMSRILRDTAEGIREDWDRDSAVGWLRRSRGLEDDLSKVRSVLDEADESLRLNPRGRRSGSTGRLRHASRALDHAAGQVRAITRGVADLASGDHREPVEPPRLPEEYSALLMCAAEALDAYRRHLRAGGGPEDVVEAIHQGQSHAQHLSAADYDDPSQTRLLGSLLQEPMRLLQELSPDGAHGDAYGP